MSGDKRRFLFVLLLLLLYVGSDPPTMLVSRPHGDHAWAQCDRASVALNYFQFHYPFAQPHTHNVMYNPSGIAAGEFPLIPFLVAKLYGVLGFHEFVFRIVTLVFSLLGFFLAFSIAGRYLKNGWWQLGAAGLWLLSPNLIYYSTGFLPDNVALTFFIIGIYFLPVDGDFEFGNLLLFSVFSGLAVLLKSSVVFLVGAVFISIVITAFCKNELRKRLLPTILLVIPLVLCLGWIVYGRQLQQLHHSAVFKLGLMLPGSFSDLTHVMREMAMNLTKIYPVPVLLLLPVLFVVLIRNFDAADFLHVFTLAAFAMWLVFFVCMMRNAGHHGYYHLPFQFAVFTLCVCCFRVFEAKKMMLSRSLSVGAAVLFLVAMVLHSLTLRKISRHSDFVNFDWEKTETRLRYQGIMNTDKIFSAEDHSYNISLYMMNQPGWTCTEDVWDSYKVDALKDCEYAVLTDTTYIHRPQLQAFFGSEVMSYESLHVYRLKH